MPRSSASVAALASALAKAQAELVNPEKSLVGTLPAERGQAERSFRYASLAGGLDIVRKTLGGHEIAIIQTTAVDRDTSIIKLTTTLAHASGEWIASDWPVCPLADLPTPRRMGAALTYARRYALFTMVGIAGEDDLDAPDLAMPSAGPLQVVAPPLASASPQRGNGKGPPAKVLVTLSPADSQRQRDQLLAELISIGSLDEAATWAKRSLPLKNTLTREHAGEVEAQFELATARFSGSAAEPDGSRVARANGGQKTEGSSVQSEQPDDQAALTFEYAPRRRDKNHLRFVASQPCLLCSRRPSDPHHLRFAQPQAMGRKVSDEFTVPLCRTHHRQVHRVGNEAQWWSAMDRDIDPMEVAKGLWEQSRSQPHTVRAIPSPPAPK